MTHVPHSRKKRWEKHTCVYIYIHFFHCVNIFTIIFIDEAPNGHVGQTAQLSGIESRVHTDAHSFRSDTLGQKSFNGGNGGQRADYCLKGKKNNEQPL